MILYLYVIYKFLVFGFFVMCDFVIVVVEGGGWYLVFEEW